MHTACDYVWINANNDWLYRKEAVIIIFSDQQFLARPFSRYCDRRPITHLNPPPPSIFFLPPNFFFHHLRCHHMKTHYNHYVMHIKPLPRIKYTHSPPSSSSTPPSPLHTLLISTSSFNYALVLWYDLIYFKYESLQCSYLILAFDKSFHDDTVGIFITHLLLIQY